MSWQEFKMIHDIDMQKIINDEVNKDGIYDAYINVVRSGNYSEALKLNQEMHERVSKIYSEATGKRKKQAKLRLELLEKTVEDIQLALNPNHNQEERKNE